MTLAPVPDQASVPPQNLEAEESVLGAVMLSPGAITACRDVLRADGGEFYRESHARVWRAALAIADAGEPVDAITLTDRLEETGDLEGIGGRARVYELAALVPATANAAHYASIVVENARLRELIRVGGMIARLGWERPGEIAELEERARGLIADLDRSAGTSTLDVETWAQFERSATETIPTLVDELWPASALGFIAGPPKKGKTWIGLDLAIAVATGTPFLSRFEVAESQPVVYLALEGHRAAIRGRIGVLARGRGLDPSKPIPNLHVVYKPRGLNLSDPAWVRTVRDAVQHVGAQLLLVDVLRRAAALKENDNQAFGEFLLSLDPIAATGCSIGVLHHFGKLTELTKDRTPGERMSGAGAMYGAFDVGVFITGSDDGARRLRIEFETRDLAAPDQLGLYLAGDTSGKNGGFVFSDSARWEIEEMPDEGDVKAPATELRDWIAEQGGEATSSELRYAFEISLPTLQHRERRLELLGVEVIRKPGKATIYRTPEPATPPDDAQQTLIAPISETRPLDPESDPESDHPERLSGSETFGVKTPSDAGETELSTTTEEHPESPHTLGVENGRFAGTSDPETPYLYYVEADAAGAGQPPEQDDLSSDDIDWGLDT